jgi:hypothetical protein
LFVRDAVVASASAIRVLRKANMRTMGHFARAAVSDKVAEFEWCYNIRTYPEISKMP